MKISVGIPSYDSKLTFSLISCLLTETSIACGLGDEIIPRFIASCTNLAVGRNQIVNDFLESDNDRLVFIDADITFPPGSLVKLAHYPVDIVAGAYRKKCEPEVYPISFLDEKEIWSNSLGLIEVKSVATGFLSLSRDIFKKFRDSYPDRYYPNGDKQNYCYFQIPYKPGRLYTEDAYFCEEWFATGGKIYLDPEIELKHWDGNIPYAGQIGKWMRGITLEEYAKNKIELTPNAHEVLRDLLAKNQQEVTT